MPRFFCIRIFLTPEKDGKEIQIKLSRQEEFSLKRIKHAAFMEGPFHVLCLYATCIVT